MLFQQLVNKMSPQQVCSKLVNKLWQCCSNNLSKRYLLNRLAASLLTSCVNAVPLNNLSTRCLLNRFVTSLLTSCDNLFQQLVNKIFRNRFVTSLLTSCDNLFQQLVNKIASLLLIECHLFCLHFRRKLWVLYCSPCSSKCLLKIATTVFELRS
jgi:hypothetical protein